MYEIVAEENMVVKNTKNYTKHFKSSGRCMIGIIGQYCTTSLEKQRWKILYQKNTKNVYVTFQQQRNMYEKVAEENMAQKNTKII